MNGIVKIKENYEFRRAYARAGSLVSPYFVVYYMKNRTDNKGSALLPVKKSAVRFHVTAQKG